MISVQSVAFPSSEHVRSRCLLVAEVAQAHDGSLGTAHAFIDAAATAGADAIKFQTHIAAAESHPSEPWRVVFSRQDATRYDYWRRMEFSSDQWRGLHEHASERGLAFMSSPFSIEAVDMLRETGIDIWKVASGEIVNTPLLRRIAADGRPIVLSTGMSPISEVRDALDVLRAGGAAVTVLQCTTAYPCPPERLGLNLLGELREALGVPVGLSDHSGTTHAGIAAAALGAAMLEVHVTFSRAAFGPDVPASVTFEELAHLRAGLEFVHTALHHPVDKDAAVAEMEPLRRLFTRSLVTRRALRAGETITADDLVLKKPGTGLTADAWDDVVGRTVVVDVPADHLLVLDDLGGAA